VCGRDDDDDDDERRRTTTSVREDCGRSVFWALAARARARASAGIPPVTTTLTKCTNDAAAMRL
jgi:hypothetical protein